MVVVSRVTSRADQFGDRHIAVDDTCTQLQEGVSSTLFGRRSRRIEQFAVVHGVTSCQPAPATDHLDDVALRHAEQRNLDYSTAQDRLPESASMIVLEPQPGPLVSAKPGAPACRYHQPVFQPVDSATMGERRRPRHLDDLATPPFFLPIASMRARSIRQRSRNLARTMVLGRG